MYELPRGFLVLCLAIQVVIKLHGFLLYGLVKIELNVIGQRSLRVPRSLDLISVSLLKIRCQHCKCLCCILAWGTSAVTGPTFREYCDQIRPLNYGNKRPEVLAVFHAS
ncbi:hypothetical protein L873DRAFT_916993 [Choiromyces venosus 120613-1]|uniref:Uncharacterized protein n=1 Tax=Choiromyces venosus 120613-1 TaxID=1336337 RepID=A0A3N4JM45_9PEZI|nr:hypothetical protein L873DRAFT_916993 [Choiromyces venosus 120613-1]